MCSFMLIYICIKEFCFIKKVVEIKCKPKQNQRRMENKAGKLASSTVPWLSSFVISGTACSRCWKEGMKNKYREKGGGHDADLSRSGNKELPTSFFVWNDKHRLMWAHRPCKADVLQLCSTAIKHQSRRGNSTLLLFYYFSVPIPTKLVVRQIFAHLWRNSPGEYRLKAHQEHAQRWHTQHYWLWLFLQLSAGVAAENEQLKPEKTKTAKERSQGRGLKWQQQAELCTPACTCACVCQSGLWIGNSRAWVETHACTQGEKKHTHFPCCCFLSPQPVSALIVPHDKAAESWGRKHAV